MLQAVLGLLARGFINNQLPHSQLRLIDLRWLCVAVLQLRLSLSLEGRQMVEQPQWIAMAANGARTELEVQFVRETVSSVLKLPL